jgi:hypothetical protein
VEELAVSPEREWQTSHGKTVVILTSQRVSGKTAFFFKVKQVGPHMIFLCEVSATQENWTGK